MKINNDLIYSGALSLLAIALGGVYYYFHYRNDNPKNPVSSRNEVLLDTVSDERFDINLIDTTTSHLLTEKNIWSELYPGKKSKPNQYGGISNRAIMRVKKGVNKESTYFYSTIHRIFYYKHEGKQKAFVVLVSYPFDYYSEEPEDCHACTPEFSIAKWYYQKGGWHLENFQERWDGGMGSWGQPTALNFKMTTLGYSLEMDHQYCQGGYCEGYYVMYEIPSLKVVTDKAYTVDGSENFSDSEDEVIQPMMDSTIYDGR